MAQIEAVQAGSEPCSRSWAPKHGTDQMQECPAQLHMLSPCKAVPPVHTRSRRSSRITCSAQTWGCGQPSWLACVPGAS